MIWKPFDRNFAEALDRFRIHKKNVEKEAGLSHMIESAEARSLEQANRKGMLALLTDEGKSLTPGRQAASATTYATITHRSRI